MIEWRACAVSYLLRAAPPPTGPSRNALKPIRVDYNPKVIPSTWAVQRVCDAACITVGAKRLNGGEI